MFHFVYTRTTPTRCCSRGLRELVSVDNRQPLLQLLLQPINHLPLRNKKRQPCLHQVNSPFPPLLTALSSSNPPSNSLICRWISPLTPSSVLLPIVSIPTIRPSTSASSAAVKSLHVKGGGGEVQDLLLLNNFVELCRLLVNLRPQNVVFGCAVLSRPCNDTLGEGVRTTQRGRGDFS
jgi:hypothetical protein